LINAHKLHFKKMPCQTQCFVDFTVKNFDLRNITRDKCPYHEIFLQKIARKVPT
jgi:hypothetical protein